MLTDKQASSWKKSKDLTFNTMEERKCSRTNKLLAERKQWSQFNRMEERKCSKASKFLAERKQWIQFNRMEIRKFSQANKLLAERKQGTQFNRMEERKMLTDEIACSWKKTTNSIQQVRIEMLANEQDSSRKKAMNSTHRMEIRTCSRANKLIAERKQWTTEWKKGNAHGRTSF